MRRAGRLGALAAAAALAMAGCTSPDVNEDVTDIEALEIEEAFVAATIAELDAFPGFEERHVLLDSCYYGMHEDKVAEDADKVALTYRLPEAFAEDSAAVESLATDIQAVWEAQGYEVELEYAGDGSLWAVNAREEGKLVAWYHLPNPRIEVNAIGCVAIAEGDFVIPDPLGGVTPENDVFENRSPRTDPDDWDD